MVLVASLTQLSSCGLLKKSARKKNKKNSAITNIKIDTAAAPQPNVVTVDKALIDRYAPLWQSGVAFKTFAGKAKCHFEGNGQNQDFTAHIRIKKDEAAWVMVTAFGIVQVARIMVTQDSFQMINYLEKSYLSRSIKEANQLLPFPVDFSMLQNLLIGNPLLMKGTVVYSSADSNTATVLLKKENRNQTLLISKPTNTVTAMQLTLDSSSSRANIKLDNYQNIGGRNFSKDRAIHVFNEGTPYYLEMNFTEMNFDGAVNMPFSVAPSYQRK
jgi:hypothetical protein